MPCISSSDRRALAPRYQRPPARTTWKCIRLFLCIWFGANRASARAESPPASASWYVAAPQPGGRLVGTDRRGFWTDRGSHYRPDGKRDISLKLPESLNEKILFATLGRAGPVVVGDVGGEEGGATRLSAYDQRGGELWSVTLSGDSDTTGVSPVGLFVNPNGDVVLTGHFSGCVRFSGKEQGKRTCINERAARRFADGECDPCHQAFVALYDAHGELRSVFAPPGYPADFFAAAPDGRIALAGGWDSSLDLDPDPDPARATVVKQPGNPRPRMGSDQAFWSIFERPDGLRWLDGKALVTPKGGSAYPIGTTFDGDGALVTVVQVELGQRPRPCALIDGKLSTDVRAERGDAVVVTIDAKEQVPSIDVLPADESTSSPKLRFFSSPTGGVFAFGALRPPAGTVLVEPLKSRERELVLVGLRGRVRGLAIGVPADIFDPQAVLVENIRVCVAFNLLAQHTLPQGNRTIIIGEPHVVGQTSSQTMAIGCFRLPSPRDREAPSSPPAPPISN